MEDSEKVEQDSAKSVQTNQQSQPRGKRYERDRRGNWSRGNDKAKRPTSDEYLAGKSHGKEPSKDADKQPVKVKSEGEKVGTENRSKNAESHSLQDNKNNKGDGSKHFEKATPKKHDYSSSDRSHGSDHKDREGDGRYSDKYYEKGKSQRGDKYAESQNTPGKKKDLSYKNPKERPRKDAGRSSSESKSADASGGADLMSLLSKNTPSKSVSKSKVSNGGIKDKSGKSASALEAQWQKEEEEKRKKEKAAEEEKRREEEEKRKEEERIRQEEEAKRREEEEAQRLIEEELKLLSDYIKESNERNYFKTELRNANSVVDFPDESFFFKLDSSVKKNTAFVKKLRSLTEVQKDALTREFNNLNLTKYVGECAAAIAEAKLKMSDVPCALTLVSLFHRRYSDFTVAFLNCWQKLLLNKKDEKVTNASKLRVDLRFFADLVSIGVFAEKVGLPMLANQLTIILSTDKEDHHNLPIVLSFSKHCGDDYAGLVPRKIKLLAEKHNQEIPQSTFLPRERQKACRNLLKEYFSSVCEHLLREHKELKNFDKQNRKILQTKGELSQERKDRYEAALQAYNKLLVNGTVLGDLLHEDLPDLPENEIVTDPEAAALDIFNPRTEFQYEGDLTLFEDEETRTFYETLPDLKSFIPSILYKDSIQDQKEEEKAETSLEDDGDNLNIEDVEKELEAASTQEEVEEKVKEKSKDESKEDSAKDFLPLDDLDVEEDDNDIGGSLKLMLESFIQQLPTCVNRELIDKAAVDFCTNLNTKANRKKLVRGLFTVQRTRYDLLPFYARLVAILYPCMPDVATDLSSCLKADFKWHVRKKDQINIESKLKTVRFIGELVKFKMFPKQEALQCVKMLLFDFTHHNIEMACALLEICGRFLYRSPESHHRTKIYLDVMMRKKAALHLDSRYTTMIENAFYYSNPPDVKNEGKKDRPPMHEYIRRLVYKDLSKITTEKVLRQVRKLDWDNPEISEYTMRILTRIWNVRYNSIHCAANLLAGIAPYQEEVAVQVVDAIMEDIRVGMEINHPKFNQRRVSCVKYLGEMYNYRLVESAVIFKILYSFITYGVTLDAEMATPLDPPEHLFRIRLVCTLLNTCGQYFDRGSSKKRLDCFLTYFQRYYWFKRSLIVWDNDHPFPMDVEYLLKDTVEVLRPKLKMFLSYDEAFKAAEELDKEFRAKLAHVLPSGEQEEEEDEDTLSTIAETDEYGEEGMSQKLSQMQLTDEQSTQDSDLADRSGSVSRGASFTGGRSNTGEREESMCRSESQDDDEDDDEDDVMLSAGEEEEEDQVTVLTGGPRHVTCPEDEDFMTQFDKMLADNITARSHEAVKVPQLDIAVPLHLRKKKGVIPPIPAGLQPEQLSPLPPQQLSQPESQEDPLPEEEDVPGHHINFLLMTRKGNKQQFSKLTVPVSAEFATKYKEREEAEKMEKERMKRVVLDFHERQEEEDYQEMIAGLNRTLPSNTNRERRVRYQHPKGAPDADLIFGSKVVAKR